jgi:hypothetical protein
MPTRALKTVLGAVRREPVSARRGANLPSRAYATRPELDVTIFARPTLIAAVAGTGKFKVRISLR